MSILIHLQDPAGGFWTEQAGGAGQWIRGGQNRGPGHGAATLHIKNIKVSWLYMSWDRDNGSGVAKTEVQAMVQPHSTSKILK